jgi:hypothetical protein
MSPGWQCIDMGVRCFRTALKTPEFQSSKMNKVGAVIRRLTSTASTLIAHYTSGQSGGSIPRVGEEEPADVGSVLSPDADAAPDSN